MRVTTRGAALAVLLVMAAAVSTRTAPALRTRLQRSALYTEGRRPHEPIRGILRRSGDSGPGALLRRNRVQTLGLTQDPGLVGNWEAWRWGMWGLAMKGAVWIGLAGLFLGMGMGGVQSSSSPHL
jgi:hypothetical protein